MNLFSIETVLQTYLNQLFGLGLLFCSHHHLCRPLCTCIFLGYNNRKNWQQTRTKATQDRKKAISNAQKRAIETRRKIIIITMTLKDACCINIHTSETDAISSINKSLVRRIVFRTSPNVSRQKHCKSRAMKRVRRQKRQQQKKTWKSQRYDISNVK